jgi:hypothetical protein
MYNLNFNSNKKEFYGIAITLWEKICKKDQTFGTGVNIAKFVKDYDKAIQEAITHGDLKPYYDPEDCRAIDMWCMVHGVQPRASWEDGAHQYLHRPVLYGDVW